MPYMENHTLYYKKQCPFCQKVLRFMDDNKITMDTRDTLQPGNQNDLVRIGGKKQVPCLVINGKPSTNQTTSSPTCARRTLSAAFIAPAPSTVRTRCGRFFSCRGLLQLVPPPIHREHTRDETPNRW